MPPLLCNRVLDSPFPPRFFASFSLATTYLEPNLVGVSNSGSLWHYSIHPLRPFCQPFSVKPLLKPAPLSTRPLLIISNMSVIICLSSSFLVSFSIICTLTPSPPSVDPPSCVCCSFAITLHGVRKRMEHLNPPETLLLGAATNKAEAWRRWKMSWDLYKVASGLDQKEEKIQVATLLHVLGKECVEIFFKFCLDFRGRSE